MTIVKSSAHRRLTSHLKFQPSLANVWLFVVANHVQLILWKKFFRSIVLKSLCYHHQIVDITPKLNKGPGTRTVLTTYGLNLKNTGICSCAKNKTKKRSFRECALDRDTFDQRGHMCSATAWSNKKRWWSQFQKVTQLPVQYENVYHSENKAIPADKYITRW